MEKYYSTYFIGIQKNARKKYEVKRNVLKILLLILIFILAGYAEVIIHSDTDPHREFERIITNIQQKNSSNRDIVDPLKREFGYFIQIQSDIAKSIYYLCKDDNKSLTTILDSHSIDPLEESNVRLAACDVIGNYSLLKASMRLEKNDLSKMIIDSLNDEQLHSKELQKIMNKYIYKDLSIYHYLISKGVLPSEDTLIRLSLYGSLKDITDAITLGAIVNTKNTHYLQHALQRKTYEIAKFYMQNYSFDIDAEPHDMSYFRHYIFYLEMLDATKSENIKFFNYFVKRVGKKELEKYKDEFLKRVKEINPELYKVIKVMDEFKNK